MLWDTADQPTNNLRTALGQLEVLAISSSVCAFAIAGIVITSWKLSIAAQAQAPRLSADDRRIVDAPIVRDGAALHSQVPMNHWCVTRDDLLQFKRLVQSAIHEGRIVPTDRDQFDPTDAAIGPSIHTVCAQFIVPVTTAAGGASWALMKHPEGLPCDLFVTHGWAEGIFEFVDKVLHSWPPQARHAYCCMLSNPQALDISGLIATPMGSPFAQALQRAKYMLVVPNRQGSIYTRVWCAYEAYLGYSWKKVISTTSAPLPGFWLFIFRCECAALVGVGAAGLVSALTGLHGRAIQIICCGATCLLTAPWFLLRFKPASLLRRGLEFMGQFNTGALVGGCILDIPFGGALAFTCYFVVCVTLFAMPYSLECDRLGLLQAINETKELQRGFTGKLRDAQCSVPADGERIRQELAESGSEKDVDEAVSTLIRMGMFTPKLSKIVAKVGVLGDVSRWNRAFLTFCVAVEAILPLESFVYSTCQINWLHFLVWAELVLLLGLFVYQAPDCRAFAVSVFVLLLLVFPVWVVELLFRSDLCIRNFTLALGLNPLLMLLLLVGPERLVQVPWLGPLLIRVMLGAQGKGPHEARIPAVLVGVV